MSDMTFAECQRIAVERGFVLVKRADLNSLIACGEELAMYCEHPEPIEDFREARAIVQEQLP